MGSGTFLEKLKKEYAPQANKSRQVIKILLAVVFRSLQLIVHGLLSIFYLNSGVRVTAIKNPILLDSATTLAFKIRSRKLTSRDVVESYIERIKEINPVLNCMVDTKFEEALKEADNADNLVRNSGKSVEELEQELPLLGVPFTTKESIGNKNLKQSAGIYARKGKKAEEDADCVASLRKAGGIPLGVTNVSELCMWWESINPVYGRTRNPYNSNHIVGGSSGGEGCIQAAGGSPMGIGSDIGGSIRIPAFFNGVFGHKPSSGIGSLKGHYPLPEFDFQRSYLTSGPLTRFACDLKPILKAIAPGHVDVLNLDKKVNIKELNYYYMDDDGGNPLISPVETEIRDSIGQIVNYFQKAHKIKVEKVELAKLYYSMAIWFAKMKAPGESQLLRELTDNKGKVNVVVELMKFAVGLSNHTFPLLCVGLVEELNAPFGSTHNANLIRKCDELFTDFEELLGENSVFIYPTHPTAAPLHGEPIFRPFNVGYTAVFNTLGLPCTHVPMGLNSKGLPIGVQIVAGKNMDRLTIAVAEELEKAFGGWVPPGGSS